MCHHAHVKVFPLGGDKTPKTNDPSCSAFRSCYELGNIRSVLSGICFSLMRHLSIKGLQLQLKANVCIDLVMRNNVQVLHLCGNLPMGIPLQLGWAQTKQLSFFNSSTIWLEKKTFLLMGANPAGISGHFVAFLPPEMASVWLLSQSL